VAARPEDQQQAKDEDQEMARPTGRMPDQLADHAERSQREAQAEHYRVAKAARVTQY
jgi:hypothetical protein